MVWNFPDRVPQHREPLYQPAAGPGRQVPDPRRQEGVLAPADAVQDRAGQKNKDIAKKFPLILTCGRLVEYEGGGDETRSNPWLAELQQEKFVEINPTDANDRGVRNGEYVWVKSPTGAQIKVKALVTERVGRGTMFIPFHFAGWWQGKDMLPYYPDGAAPIVRGEAVNTATTYGYDTVTMMQETKTTLCQVERAGIREERNDGKNEIPLRRRALHRVQRLRHRLQERARGAVGRQPAPRRHHQRRRARRAHHLGGVHALLRCAVHGGVPGRLLLQDRRGRRAARQGPLHRLRLLLLRLPVRRAAVPATARSACAARWTSARSAPAVRKPNATRPSTQKYGRNRLAEGKLPACAEMCSTKALLGGDGDVVADIYRERVMNRGKGGEVWGWGTAYGKPTQGKPAGQPAEGKKS